MASRLDLSKVGAGWYKDERGEDEFNVQDFIDGEYADEREFFDINGRTECFSAAIGANWYYAKDDMTMDDLAPTNVVRIDEYGRISLNGEVVTPVSLHAKAMDKFKPLPALPKPDWVKPAQDVTEGSLAKDAKSPVGARISTVPTDYMFRDANETEISTTHGNDDDSLVATEMDDDEFDVVEDVGPATPRRVFHFHGLPNIANQALDHLANIDTSALHNNSSQSAEIAPTTADLIEQHILALNTGVAAPLTVDQAHEADKAGVTNMYFNGPVCESPSRYHAPLFDGESGYGDVREGMEHLPHFWPQFPPSIKSRASSIVKTIEKEPVLIDLTIENILNKQPVLIDLTAEDDTSEGSSWTTKKRRAHSSFATKSVVHGGNNDDELQYLYTKKVRVNAEKDDDEVFSVGRPSTYSLITEPDDDDVVTPVSHSALLRELHGVKGFKGQFHGIPTTEQAARATKLNAHKIAVYMGKAEHLNNLILHKDIHTCPYFETTEYDATTAGPDTEIGRCISYAAARTDEAAEMVRVPTEEALRTEAHREAALARLCGVVVGELRYHDGHLTVDEYHERNMCICWQLCECSKLCTRFADLMCPCRDKIETNCH